MISPRISVVMPVYNGEKYLHESIDSILGQTFEDFEFIIVNDCSTDASESIILSYTDPRIVYLKNNVNCGICISLNRAINIAKGEYIARMDCDDISFISRLQEQLHFLELHQEIAVLGTDIIVFGDGIVDHRIEMLHSAPLCRMGLIFNSCCAHPSVMMRRSVLEKYHLLYKTEFQGYEDYELWWQVSKVSKITNLNKVLLKYRKHSAQVTQNYDSEYLAKTRRFLDMRMHDIGADLSSEQSEAMFCYCTSQFSEFTKEHLNHLIEACVAFHDTFKDMNYHDNYALRVTLSQAIIVAIQKAGLQAERWTSIRKIRKYGLMPFSLYLRILFSQFKSIFR